MNMSLHIPKIKWNCIIFTVLLLSFNGLLAGGTIQGITEIEGAEFEVLKTLDFNKHQFGVIFYEADGSNPQKDSDMKTRLEMHGYPFQVYAKGSNWHINANFHYIYARQEQILQEK